MADEEKSQKKNPRMLAAARLFGKPTRNAARLPKQKPRPGPQRMRHRSRPSLNCPRGCGFVMSRRSFRL